MTVDFDVDALFKYVRERALGVSEILSVEKFSTGQSNPTYLVKADNSSFVLRRKPFGDLLPSAHAIDREFKVIQALRGTDVPVPNPLVLCEDRTVIGADFYLMSFEEGRIFGDLSLPEIAKDDRAVIYDALIETLCALHTIDPQAVGLGDFGKTGNYFERQLSRWTKQYRATMTDDFPAVEELIDWLTRNLPTDDGAVSIIHGDYRLDNCVYHPDRPTVRAVLDWELSTLGHPLADLGHLCMTIGLPKLGPLEGLGGQDRSALGVPSNEALIERYCTLRGIRRPKDWAFYVAFAFFRYAAIAQGVYRRSIDGNASNESGVQLGMTVQPLAELALTEVK